MCAEFIGEGKGKYFNVNIAWETGEVVNEFERDKNVLC